MIQSIFKKWIPNSHSRSIRKAAIQIFLIFSWMRPIWQTYMLYAANENYDKAHTCTRIRSDDERSKKNQHITTMASIAFQTRSWSSRLGILILLLFWFIHSHGPCFISISFISRCMSSIERAHVSYSLCIWVLGFGCSCCKAFVAQRQEKLF